MMPCSMWETETRGLLADAERERARAYAEWQYARRLLDASAARVAALRAVLTAAPATDHNEGASL